MEASLGTGGVYPLNSWKPTGSSVKTHPAAPSGVYRFWNAWFWLKIMKKENGTRERRHQTITPLPKEKLKPPKPGQAEEVPPGLCS